MWLIDRLDERRQACTIHAMSDTPNENSWKTIVAKLKNEMPASRFDAWIHPVSAQYSNNDLVLSVPNRFFLDGLKSNYGQRILALVGEIMGADISVQFEIDPSLSPEVSDILFDPQTSGGLLISVEQGKSEELLSRLQEKGIEDATIIGEITSQAIGRAICKVSS